MPLLWYKGLKLIGLFPLLTYSGLLKVILVFHFCASVALEEVCVENRSKSNLGHYKSEIIGCLPAVCPVAGRQHWLKSDCIAIAH